MKITVDTLMEQSACEEGLEAFEAIFPDGVDSIDLFEEAINADHEFLSWLFNNIPVPKEIIQKFVILQGKPLGLDRFNWNAETREFLTRECYLMVDFQLLDSVTVVVGNGSTVFTGDCSTVTTNYQSVVRTGNYSIVTVGDYSIVKSGSCTNSTVGECFAVIAGCNSMVTTGNGATVNVGQNSTVISKRRATIAIYHNSTVTVGEYSVIHRLDVHEDIDMKDGGTIKFNDHGVKGHERLKQNGD